MLFSVLTIIAAALLLLASASIVWYTLRVGISPMPSMPGAARAIIELVASQKNHRIILDLGSGIGTLAIALARKHPESTVVAYELSPLPWLASLILKTAFGCKNLIIHRKDFFTAAFGDAATIVCYLYPAAMERLRDKFEAELKGGTVVLSSTFAVPGWKPSFTKTLDDIYGTKIYLYTSS